MPVFCRAADRPMPQGQDREDQTVKIAVTSQNFRTVTGHAGRARRFLIYDVGTDGNPVEVDRLDLPKELAMHDFHGDEAHPVDVVDVVISESFGEGFARRMGKRGIVAVTSENTDPVEAVKAYVAAALTLGGVGAEASCGCSGGPGHGHAHAHAHAHRHHRDAQGEARGSGRRRGLATAGSVEESEKGETRE